MPLCLLKAASWSFDANITPSCVCSRQVPISTLEHTVMKLYLEDFHSFCMTLGTGTAEVGSV